MNAWPLARASTLVVMLRDAAVDRLRDALPDREAEIERFLVGRKPDGTDAAPPSSRVKIIPLPSIGHHHADRGIRRVFVEVPSACPLRADDVRWAFSGLDLVDPGTGEVLDIVLTPSADEDMLVHYGVTERRTGFRVWRTVTPAALPEAARRRRIDPTRVPAEAKDGRERAAEQARASAAACQALRHAELGARAETVRVQREPFEGAGERVEAFAAGTRFAKHRLWHVEFTFGTPITGPLVIGDGRFLGLGVLAPVPRAVGIHSFVVDGGPSTTPPYADVARALRRAVMARVQDVLGPGKRLPTYFSGHQPDGSPARRERHGHLTFLFDPGSARLFVVSPHVVDRRSPTRDEVESLDVLERALAQFHELVSASLGCLRLRAVSIDGEVDPLLAPSRTWESVTPYQVTRHTRGVGADEALSIDLRAECRRCGLPIPRVTTRELHGVPGVGLVGTARLAFDVAVTGPVVLGRSRHRGGGLFVARWQ